MYQRNTFQINRLLTFYNANKIARDDPSLDVSVYDQRVYIHNKCKKTNPPLSITIFRSLNKLADYITLEIIIFNRKYSTDERHAGYIT